ncbi:oligopeptide transporter 4 [Selaginella moellendorffii]|nr:oligopeptide transporter 4 [Selaginella moellendorffii]|eukprot:XP_002960906.2 oligopeptide transporter 4 [Selaginella moellendorffii]
MATDMEAGKRGEQEEEFHGDSKEEQSPIEQVALTVDVEDDPSQPVWTFRMWAIGILACAMLSFLNQFFSYRTEPLVITLTSAQIVALPIGRFMAAVLPTRIYRVPFTGFEFSLNPGPFNKKEHVLITIFANAGSAFGNGGAYAVFIVDIIKAFYKRKIHFYTGLLLVITTQVLGYGWAGLLRKYLVEPASMWWPGNLVQVSLFKTLHDKESVKGLTRIQFFLIFLTVGFAYYALPGYLFSVLSSISWVCWAFPNSVLAQQLGSGFQGLGLGAIGLDWASASSYLGSPLVSPFFAIANVAVGYILIAYVMMPTFYWANIYNAKTFPIFSSHLFTSKGQIYDIQKVVNDKFELDMAEYQRQGPIHMSTFFAMTYGFGFAAVASTITHVLCFHGKDIWRMSRSALKSPPDVHARMMQRYPTIPNLWFVILMLVSLGVAIATCLGFKEQIQLPWWGVILSCAIAATFTLPVGVITATTNITPGLNIITEYIVGYMLPGKPIANVVFKTYGYMSMTQALSFLSDFKLGHYMKIPPRSMFTVQIVGTIIAATVNMGVAWWLLNGIDNICDTEKLPASSPWTCPSDRVFFDASVIWGLVGPKRIFGSLGEYSQLSWFFLIGILAPIPVWILSRALPKVEFLRYVNIPVILGATGYMPPATSVNYTTWITLGVVFNYFVYKYRKAWWKRYNYVLSAALDAGSAFMAVVLYFSLGLEDVSLTWWGTSDRDHCPLAKCPTQPGIVVDGCPVYS